MNAVDRLIANYQRQVALPWAQNLAGKQRVWFAVYPPAEERRIRAHLQHFETATLEAKHSWLVVDLTRLLPEWLSQHEYRDGIFAEPHYLTAHQEVEELAIERIKTACSVEEADSNTVVALVGLGCLFDFIRVSRLLDAVEAAIRGRLLVFFPGEYRHNSYRFMDARDGFNYMAVPITTTESFLRS
ncbi:MAG: hypothetical protein OJF47_000046 [Nitrospira sp.]|jgi:hypothetical protein|nr:MAG: hypothetical protein OJF47_000046 [Nitrospira sp.]